VKIRSLRLKVALFAAVLATLVVFVFAVFSAWWFYHEQIDMVSGEESRPATPQQVAEAREETSELMIAYLAALPLAAVLSALGAWWVAARLTTPLARLSTAASSIDALSLDVRLPEPATRDEIFTLSRTLNHLLDRLERSFRQSTRFSADASHELRTPLAVMRTQLEHAIKDEPNGSQTGVLVELLEENHRLSSIADKLLLLAKADGGRLLPGRADVDLSKLVAEVAEDYGVMAQDRGLKIDGDIAPAIWIHGDRGLLRQLAFNLFDNAVRHNIPEGWVRYHLAGEGAMVRLSIFNSGSSIPESHRDLLFERFFRLDESRERDVGGTGLGLSLCREIVHAHGGRIVMRPGALSSENEFMVELPMADSQKSPVNHPA
jgi:signal transduction histidine kinase